MAVSCSKNGGDVLEEVETPVCITANQTTILTKASDGLYSSETGFDGGETVKVFVNSPERSADFTVGAPDASHKSVLTGTLYYPSTGDLTLYAVYPSTSVSSHTVAYDQSSDSNYKASDLMFARKSVDQADKKNPQNLQFDHKLVKLKVNVNIVAGISAVTKIEMFNVKRQVAVSAGPSSMTVAEPASATDGQGDNIKIFEGSQTETGCSYACVFPAQGWDNEDFIKVTADGKTVTYKLTRSSWTAGSQYELTLNINAAALNTVTSISGWSDNNPDVVIYPTTETKTILNVTSEDIGWIITPDGCVYENKSSVDAAGKTGVAMIVYIGDPGSADASSSFKGLAISLESVEVGDTWRFNWCSPSVNEYCLFRQYSSWMEGSETDADKDMNGIQNTLMLQGHPTHTHPAANSLKSFSVLAPVGSSGWFIPSAGQWKKFLYETCGIRWNSEGRSTNGSADITTVNAFFNRAGYTTSLLYPNTRFCCSTESVKGEDNAPLYWSFDFGTDYTDGGIWIYPFMKDRAPAVVRPFVAF